jgi:hypothetical protein
MKSEPLEGVPPLSPLRNRTAGLFQRLSRVDWDGWAARLSVFMIAAVLIFSRRPGLFLHPQFYGEDGVWFSQAYNLGWAKSLGMIGGGYFVLFPKLVYGLALLVPLHSAPLITVLAGLVCQALPVLLLLSSRCISLGSFPVRVLMAVVYLALPNSQEVHVVLTNAQWHLAVFSILIILSKPPTTWFGKLFDVASLIVCGLTGPFCFLLMPVAVIMGWIGRQKWKFLLAVILVVSAAFQVACLLNVGFEQRSAYGVLGATPLLFFRILSGQVFVGAVWGMNYFGERTHPTAVIVVTSFGILLWAVALLKTSPEQKLFVIFSILMFLGGLKSPLISGPAPQWQLLLTDVGCRYWFFPILAFLWSLIWCAGKRPSIARYTALAILMVGVRGAVHNWKYYPFEDQHFPTFARQFEAAPSGVHITIPILPKGQTLSLVKK